MNPMSLIPALAAMILSLLLAPPGWARSPDLAGEWNGPAIKWRDIATGIREATETRRPVVMVFHAPWCTSCRRYREVFKDPAVVEASRHFVMILIDADADKLANGAFSPDGTYVPRTIFLDWEGNIRKDIIGSTDPEHPHTIDINGPAELLSLMRRAAPESAGPPQTQASQ